MNEKQQDTLLRETPKASDTTPDGKLSEGTTVNCRSAQHISNNSEDENE